MHSTVSLVWEKSCIVRFSEQQYWIMTAANFYSEIFLLKYRYRYHQKNISDNISKWEKCFKSATPIAVDSGLADVKDLANPLFLKEYKSLKKDLDYRKRINGYMESSGRRWIENYSRLKKE